MVQQFIGIHFQFQKLQSQTHVMGLLVHQLLLMILMEIQLIF